MQSRRPPPVSDHYFNLCILGGRGWTLYVNIIGDELLLNFGVKFQR